MKQSHITKSYPVVNGVRSKHIADMPVTPDKPYIVKGMLLERQVSILAGPPNTGKSSVVGAILSQVSQGKKLGSMRVRKSVIFYVGAEDPDGIASRTHGHFSNQEAKSDVEFFVYDEPINMSCERARDNLIKAMLQFKSGASAEHLLIVFDTLTLSIGDSDENLASDMRRVIHNAQILARRTSAHVMFIHHTPTSDEGRLRGSSALNGNSDTVMILNAAEKDDVRGVLLKATKQRSIAKGKSVGFEMKQFDLGVDSDGDVSTAPLALLTGDVKNWKPKAQKKAHQKSDAPARKAEVLRVLAELSRTSAEASVKQIAAVVEAPFDRSRMKQESLKKAVRIALGELVAEGDVTRIGGHEYAIASSGSTLF